MSTDLDAVEPDDKDWTWVIEQRCPECGFDGSTVDATGVAGMIRHNAVRWVTALGRSADELRARTDPMRWTDLEYAAHVRDVYRLYLVRLDLMLTEDDPLYPNWDQDETARTDRYNEQDPATVSDELQSAARALADAFDRVAGDEWRRPGRRSDGASFTVDTFARYLIHDPIHHLADLSTSG
ncbi:MAG: DinB family protein [Actinomycetota bacterium]